MKLTKRVMSGCLSKPLTFFCMENISLFVNDISNVIYLFRKKIIDTIIFYSTLKSISFWISPKTVTGYIAKKRVAILKKKGKNNKYLCLRYSKIFIYHIILR